MAEARYRLGFDIGGTFTDFVLLDAETGEIRIGKCLTTPSDPSIGALRGIERVLAEQSIALSDLDLAIHGTTLVANAIIERRGATIALLTTEGYRDLLEIGHGTRYDLYNYFLVFPQPLVSRRLRLEVPERILPDGSVHKPIDIDAVNVLVDSAVQRGARAIAVCFLHSYQNSSHEEAAARAIAARHPDIPITLSSELVREVGEIERVSTATANAYVQPLMKSYLRKLERVFSNDGPSSNGHEESEEKSRLYLMVSSGGTTSVQTAEEYPITLIESGPAAGALAAAYFSKLTGLRNVISFDMGGTTAKACLIDDGQPATSTEFEAAREERFKRGSGIPLKVPVIDLIEIGAGGGSIAHIDAMGLLKVGPESASADPGPACYGQGGESPTVTDANLVLGYLDPGYFLGGEMKLDKAAAIEAIEAKVARPLGIDVVEAAWGIHDIVNENMAGATRTHVAEKNRDPRKYALIAFGGAGPAHAGSVARKVRAPRIVVPLAAGATSALGLLVAPPAFDFVHSHVGTLQELDWALIQRIYDDLEARGRETMAQAGVPADQIRYERSVDMRYVGQWHRINVALPTDDIFSADDTAAEVASRFTQQYEQLYSLLNPEYPIEALSWRLRVIGPEQQVNLKSAMRTTGANPRKGSRMVYFRELHKYVECPVYDHYLLSPGTTIDGPAIFEQRESTAVVGPGDSVWIDDC